MTLPTFTVATQPSISYAAVTINSTGWTALWPADDTRSFAAVIGGTGTPGEIIYITANPAAAVSDPDVAQNNAVRGPLYFETRGVNALYARLAAGGPLTVRTTISNQVSKNPVPTGVLATKTYKVVTSCGGGAVTYVGGIAPTIQGSYAAVLDREDDRNRTTLLGNASPIMLATNFEDPDAILPLITIQSFAASGPFFPGPLPVEGVNALSLLDFNGVGQQTAAYWISDKAVVL